MKPASNSRLPQYGQALDTLRRLDTVSARGDVRRSAVTDGPPDQVAKGPVDVFKLSPQARDIKSTQEMLLTEFGKRIEERFGEAGVKLAETVGLDFAPEATARRIFDFAIGMRGIFERQNEDLAPDDALDSFEKTIRGAVDTGYADAVSILKGLELDDSVLETAATTRELVDEKFDEYFADARDKT